MSWSLSLDRAPRSRKQTTYSDTTRYKEVTNDDDNLSKKKRGRPPRVNGPENGVDGASQPKRRGRPPKFPKLQTQNNHNSPKANEDPSKIAKYKLTKKYDSSSSSKSSESDVDDEREYYSVDYAYEYEYEYENENSENEKKPLNTQPIYFNQNQMNQIDVKPSKPIGQPKNPIMPLKQVKKISKSKGKLISDSLQKNDIDFYIVQEIIGKNDNLLEPKNSPNQYFVKFLDMPYNYSRWLSESELSNYEGGEIALKKFTQKCDSEELIRSISIPHLMIFSDTEILTQWFEVDRIFGIQTINNNSNANLNDAQKSSLNEERKNNNEYLVKWKDLDYDAFSVESLESFEDSAAITAYQKRLLRMNPKKIPTRWVHPNISQLVKVTQLPISKKGEVFRDFQLEGLNWLIECWYQRRFSIFGDMTREGKIPELICMLNFLSNQFQINGPFLVLASENQVYNWKEEFENWSNLNVVVLGGNSSSRQITIDQELEVRDDHGRLIQDYIRCDVLLASYKTFLSNSQNLMEIDWRYVIADDGFKMKNSRGRVRNSLKQLKYEHITLSMEWEMLKPKNDYQIFFLMNFINPKFFNNFNEFVNTFVPYEGEKMIKLNHIIEPFLLSRDVDMIHEKMKEKEEIVIVVQPSIIQKRLYIEAVKKKTDILMKPITDQADVPLTQLITLLREIINHPILAFAPDDDSDQQQQVISDLTLSCGKMHFIDQLLKDLVPQRKRIMIFSQFVPVFEVIEHYLKDNEYSYERIDSMTTADERINIINRYMSSDTSVFLFSSKPGSYQIDLNLFDYVVIYDKDNYIFQSEMRGTLYRLITNGSFEMNRAGKNEADTSFDEQTLQYLTHLKYRIMDAEDIELMLRDTIRPMFDKNDEIINNFFTKSLTDILSDCIKTDEMFDEESAVINYQKQKKFWNELLKPPQMTKKKDKESVSPDQVTRAKQLISSLIDHGFQGGNDQLDLLKCALTLNPPKDDKSLQYLNEIVGDNSSDAPVHRFGGWAFLIDKLASKMFDNVVFFARLRRALYFAGREDVKWPQKPDMKDSENSFHLKDFDPLDEYTMMYMLDKNGSKQLSASFEKAKELKSKQIEKRILSIIESIENQYSISGGFPQISKKQRKKDDFDSGSDLEDDENDSNVSDNDNETFKFDPMSPDEWADIHPNLIVRNLLSEEDVDRIFEVLSEFGIPISIDYKPDIRKFASIADLSNLSLNNIEDCLIEIIKIGFSLLKFSDDDLRDDDQNRQKIENEKFEQLLSGRYSNKQYLNAIFVCRLMTKVYSFLNEIDSLESDKKITNLKEAFGKVNMTGNPNYTIDQLSQFFYCLSEFGVSNTNRWSSEIGLTDFPPTVESRLKFASTTIDNYRSPKALKSINNLSIFNFGHFVDLPSFAHKNCPYPIGFLSTRCLSQIADVIPPQKWFRCEIQSVGFFPVFVVSLLDDPENDFVDTFPLEAWKSALGKAIGNRSIAEEIFDKTQLTGEWLFGLTHPDIKDLVQEICKKNEKNGENSHSENSENA